MTGLHGVLTCVSSQAYSEKQLLGVPVGVQMVTDRGQLRPVNGIVTKFRRGQSDGGLTVCQLTVADSLSVLEIRPDAAVASPPQISRRSSRWTQAWAAGQGCHHRHPYARSPPIRSCASHLTTRGHSRPPANTDASVRRADFSVALLPLHGDLARSGCCAGCIRSTTLSAACACSTFRRLICTTCDVRRLTYLGLPINIHLSR
ncbi:contractile injection system protein, VgrG/Pvc8 family [Paraburkholderia tropica]|uniref:contractile injection system protein, VgrG/Pvc8 family n=1 Tax=Paraburkholderia tropica TaxID=92647 RepID=UPI003AFA1F0C